MHITMHHNPEIMNSSRNIATHFCDGDARMRSMKSLFGALSDAAQLKQMSETVRLAFRDDPTWSPIVEERALTPETPHTYWSLFVRSASRYPWMGRIHGTDSVQAAVSVWFPPGSDELTAEEVAAFPAFAEACFGAEASADLFEITDRFDAARPNGDYFYLSLLAVHPSRRGEGLGMQLLRSNLDVIDALGVPSYLESSNPANDHRYERLGYRKHGNIHLPSGLTLTTMWRDPHPAPAI